jgi:hypothetical protein
MLDRTLWHIRKLKSRARYKNIFDPRHASWLCPKFRVRMRKVEGGFSAAALRLVETPYNIWLHPTALSGDGGLDCEGGSWLGGG